MRNLAFYKGAKQIMTDCLKTAKSNERRRECERAIVHADRQINRIEKSVGIGERIEI